MALRFKAKPRKINKKTSQDPQSALTISEAHTSRVAMRELDEIHAVDSKHMPEPDTTLDTGEPTSSKGKRRRSATPSRVSDDEMDNAGEDDELEYLDLPPTSAPRSSTIQELPIPSIPSDTSRSIVAFTESAPPIVPCLVDATTAAQDDASATSRPSLDDSLIDPQLLRQAVSAPSAGKDLDQPSESEPAAPLGDMPEDSEGAFCWCHGLESGSMVQCDGPKCEQWYHFECVDLLEAPVGKWFCKEECRASAGRRPQGRKKRRTR
ncbi:hypothetical protein B0H21DRAFT_895314 [Amylocystis lapponica]|nr:hypothetical protein B0H21DRAFT_895314 [Amylocystis lapponica]